MAYEVVKTIRGHAYRYSVESYRDPQTGKARNRWHYLGKADDRPAEPRRRRTAAATRLALADALERLLVKTPWDDITATAIASEAGVAEATLYRHFASRMEILRECAGRVNEALEERLVRLLDVAETSAEERRRLRAWIVDMVHNPPGASVLLALWSAGGSPEMRAQRSAQRTRAFIQYFTKLRDRGLIPGAAPFGRLAAALSLIVQSFSYHTVVEHRRLTRAEDEAVADVAERIVFETLPDDVG